MPIVPFGMARSAMKPDRMLLLGFGQAVDILPNAGTHVAFGPWGVCCSSTSPAC